MTQIIIGFISMIKNIVGFLLPDVIFVSDVFTNFADYIVYFVEFLIKVNFLIPLPTIFMCLQIMLSLKVIKFGIFIFNWFVRAVLDVIP